MEIERSALVVLIPEAGREVEAARTSLDSGAALGVPAHVTVLFPFMPAGDIDDDVLVELSTVFCGVPSFDAVFDTVGWFGESVVFLAPWSGAEFCRLTEAVVTRWPQWPPYEGVYDGSSPHLTIGDSGSVDDLRAAAESVVGRLPITSRVSEVNLFVGTSKPGSWSSQAKFPLGAAVPE